MRRTYKTPNWRRGKGRHRYPGTYVSPTLSSLGGYPAYDMSFYSVWNFGATFVFCQIQVESHTASVCFQRFSPDGYLGFRKVTFIMAVLIRSGWVPILPVGRTRRYTPRRTLRLVPEYMC
jgi:hypothetical protein